LRRRLLRRKAGRYAHLGEVSYSGEDSEGRRGSTWKEQANGDRGILAHEFDDFAIGSDCGDEEAAVGGSGNGESKYVR